VASAPAGLEAGGILKRHRTAIVSPMSPFPRRLRNQGGGPGRAMEKRRYEVTREFDAVQQNNPAGVILRVVPPVVVFSDTEIPGVVRFTFEGVSTMWLVDPATSKRCARLAPYASLSDAQ
jgi:hypothetical protein